MPAGPSIEQKLLRYPEAIRDDLRQEFELERAKAVAAGRPPRRFDWVARDWVRLQLGRGKTPRERVSFPENLAADPPAPVYAKEDSRRRVLVDRAMRIALGLPEAQRVPIVLALRCLASREALPRVHAWLLANPGRRVPQRVIAAETGLTREAVCRSLVALRRGREVEGLDNGGNSGASSRRRVLPGDPGT